MSRDLLPSADRTTALDAERRALGLELDGLRREEEYLASQVRQAREQVLYYESLLGSLKSQWTRPLSPDDVVRRLS